MAGRKPSRERLVASPTATWCFRDDLPASQSAEFLGRTRETGEGTFWQRPVSCGADIFGLLRTWPAAWRARAEGGNIDERAARLLADNDQQMMEQVPFCVFAHAVHKAGGRVGQVCLSVSWDAVVTMPGVARP